MRARSGHLIEAGERQVQDLPSSADNMEETVESTAPMGPLRRRPTTRYPRISVSPIRLTWTLEAAILVLVLLASPGAGQPSSLRRLSQELTTAPRTSLRIEAARALGRAGPPLLWDTSVEP